MTVKRNFARGIGVLAAAVFGQALVAVPALAQDDQGNDCICVVAPGTVGLVTSATGWVKLNGDVGLVDATENAPLSVGSVLRTGVAGEATATVGQGCNVDVAALSEMSIRPLEDGRLCVRLTQDAPGTSIDPLVVGGSIAALAGGFVMLSLGQDDSVSK